MSDICLILEGTYPYVVGGVSTWVHSLIAGLPDLEFALMHIRAGDGRGELKFEPPANLRERLVVQVDNVHYTRMPQAAVYHALSTGFAGLLGVEFKRACGRPLLLTEHGVYWHEAALGAGEIECGLKVNPAWAGRFREVAGLVYREADAVVTVCQANRRLQLAAGAPPEKCRIIPNGVEADASRPRRPPGDSPSIGLVGRVVPLKDVATFIAACRILADALPAAEFLVIGPTDQDEGYVQECLELRRDLGLDGRLRFTGEVDPRPYYQLLDVMVLTSISEGQPLAMLEAMAAGRPVVATDVGGCAETLGASGPEAAGIVTPPRDAQATAQAVLQLCRNEGLYTRLSAAGPARVSRFYSRERFLTAYRALYEMNQHRR
jgi:glycosyltransferase involved in cell wall biosynthesis